MKNLFEHKSYKRYLLESLRGNKQRSGERARLAKHLGCQSAHVSQVLNGSTHFSAEQAFRINEFLGHDREEAHFFTLLLSKDRAGTVELRDYYQLQIEEILNRRAVIKNRVNTTREVPVEVQTRYYSSWHYSAIHIALSIPELRTKEALAGYFRLPLLEVANALEFLLSVGLCDLKDGRYLIGQSHIHLGSDSDNINKHHFNWRVQAMQSLTHATSRDLHYSVVYSLSRDDAAKIQARIVDMIKANLKDVGPSKEEVLYCTSIDFFELGLSQ